MTELSLAARAFLGEPRYATLATINHDGSPQQTAVWYDVEGDAILMNTTAGRLKYRNLLRDPRASLCVTDAYRVVTLSGWVQLDDDLDRTDFEWDTTTTPSGIYQLKIVASDHKDNPDNEALTAERVSTPFDPDYGEDALNFGYNFPELLKLLN